MLDDFHGTPSGSAMRIRLSEGRQIANQAIDRFAQALHRKLDIIGLEMTPALKDDFHGTPSNPPRRSRHRESPMRILLILAG